MVQSLESVIQIKRLHKSTEIHSFFNQWCSGNLLSIFFPFYDETWYISAIITQIYNVQRKKSFLNKKIIYIPHLKKNTNVVKRY